MLSSVQFNLPILFIKSDHRGIDEGERLPSEHADIAQVVIGSEIYNRFDAFPELNLVSPLKVTTGTRNN